MFDTLCAMNFVFVLALKSMEIWLIMSWTLKMLMSGEIKNRNLAHTINQNNVIFCHIIPMLALQTKIINEKSV